MARIKSDQYAVGVPEPEEGPGESGNLRGKRRISRATTLPTGCNLNSTGCKVTVAVERGKIVDVQPNSADKAAGLCPRLDGLMEWQYSKERLTKPLKREGSGWREVSWDEALTFVAGKLAAIKEKHGARAVVVNTGQGLVRNVERRASKRFARAFGTPNFTSGDSFCFWSRAIGHSIAFGIGDSVANVDLEYTNCIFMIGHNPTESAKASERRILAAKARGAKLIVVDPRMIPLAKEADIYTPIRPGTDCALILSMLNVIISEKLYDADFVEKWTHGFKELAEHVKSYPPEGVEKITWVPAATIRAMARMYATGRPSAMSSGVAIDHSTSGSQSNWALAIMIAICGNYETDGGNFPVVRLIDQRNADQLAPEACIGSKYPVFSKICGESTIVPMADAIMTGKPYPIKALIVQCANPALTFPNTNKACLALRSLDLLVVMDLFMTETAQLADIVLPSATCLESPVLREGGTNPPSFIYQPNVIEPGTDCWPLWKFWAELGKKLGLEADLPWRNSEEYFEYYLKPFGVSMKDLDNPQHIAYEPEAKDRSYRANGFNTTSGKVDLYSDYLKSLGYDPMPTYREPAEGWVTKPELAEKYPLIMITGTRNRLYHHTQYRNLPSVRKQYPEPLLEINTRTAARLGIEHGDTVNVESPRGSIRIKAELSNDIHESVVSVPHGWRDTNVNMLTSDAEVDPVTAFIGFKSVLCRVTKE
jgi:formate dehydrogenase (coenzyme F420) alpha subunit